MLTRYLQPALERDLGRKVLLVTGPRQCGKTTWAGCGRHVDNVMKDVPQSRQCTCSPEVPPAMRTGVFRSLFRR